MFFLSCSPEQMLLLLPLDPERAWGTVAPHKHHYILLQFPSHLLIPIFLSLSQPPLLTHPLSAQVVDCGIISSLLVRLYDALQHPAPILTSDHFSQAVGEGEGRRESVAAGGLMHSMYLTSVPVNVALKQNGKNNEHVIFTKLGNQQIALHKKLQKPFGDIICMTKHVSSTDWET